MSPSRVVVVTAAVSLAVACGGPSRGAGPAVAPGGEGAAPAPVPVVPDGQLGGLSQARAFVRLAADGRIFHGELGPPRAAAEIDLAAVVGAEVSLDEVAALTAPPPIADADDAPSEDPAEGAGEGGAAGGGSGDEVYDVLHGDEVGEMQGGFGFGRAGGPCVARAYKYRNDAPVVLVADPAAPAGAALAVIGVLGAPTAIAARGSDPARGGAMRLTLHGGTFAPADFTVQVGAGRAAYQVEGDEDGAGQATGMVAFDGLKAALDGVVDPSPEAHTAAALSLDDGATAGDLFGAIAALTVAGVDEIALLDLPSDACDLGWGTIGTGSYGTIGLGSGTGSGHGVGSGRGGVGANPSVRIGNPTANGDLDKAIIRRYIKRNLPKISYCYEKQLLVHPTLEGTVTAQFLIQPSGQVGTSTAVGVDPDVAACVAGVIRAIEFPKPKGGGSVQVSYPFIFRPTGG